MNAPKTVLTLAAIALALPEILVAKAPALSKMWAGTWELNASKSNFGSPTSTEKSETRIYTVANNRITMKSTSTNNAGKVMSWSYSTTADGKWSPAVGNPNFDRISLRITGEREMAAQTRHHGKPSGNGTLILSADGKQLTLHRSVSKDTLVFDRAK